MKNARQVSYLLQDYKLQLPTPDENWPFDIRDGLNCINKHMFDPGFTVKTMRDQCNIKAQDFSSRFDNYIGFSPRAYITHHRIQLAKILLKDKEFRKLHVNTLGFFVGFEKPSSFSMTFRNHAGISPKKWRKNIYLKK